MRASELDRPKLLAKLIRYFHTSDYVGGIALAVAIGLVAGFGGVALTLLIRQLRSWFFDGGANVFWFLGDYYIVLIPALGGLLVGPIVHFVSPETRGHGVPEVIQAIQTAGGRMRARVAGVKVLASAITIGSGGSAGREGPIVQVGATIGSVLGQGLQLPAQRLATLAACGAAGGISAAFNAPVGGALFAMEVILGDWSADAFGLVVIASVAASVVSRVYLGAAPAFAVPTYEFNASHWWELSLYLLLGVFAGVAAKLYIWLLYSAEDAFDTIKRLPRWLTPALGGLLVGILALVVPQALGTGYEEVSDALQGNIAWQLALLFVAAKLIATAFTLGSGGSGGVFAPGFYIGAMLGCAFGKLANLLLPGMVSPPGAYALVGMGSVFGAAAHAPLTNVIMLFEMSGDYSMILPMMVGVVVSTLVLRSFSFESIYTLKLSRRGIHLGVKKANPMQLLTVAETMSADTPTLLPVTSVEEAAQRFLSTSYTAFPLVDGAGDLVGIITHGDVEKPVLAGNTQLPIGLLSTAKVITCFPDENLELVLSRMAANSISRLVVVDRLNPTKPLGMITRKDIVAAYSRSMKELSHIHPRLRRRIAGQAETRVLEFGIGRDSPLAGQRLADLALPEGCLMVLVERGRQIIIPRGELRLEVGDHVTMVSLRHAAELLLAKLRRGEGFLREPKVSPLKESPEP